MILTYAPPGGKLGPAAAALAGGGGDRLVREALRRFKQLVETGEIANASATGWLGGKISQLTLGRQAAGTLGTFQALETLALGVLGKVALWRALMEVAPSDARLSGLDFQALAERAQAQHARVEGQRLALARPALQGGDT